ncbi:MAG: hypothetical protein MZV49_13225 [Rhodopseudomonas palustris]|nr:hypothetical protein [Rhodopseudomonas palustris]
MKKMAAESFDLALSTFEAGDLDESSEYVLNAMDLDKTEEMKAKCRNLIRLIDEKKHGEKIGEPSIGGDSDWDTSKEDGWDEETEVLIEDFPISFGMR